MIYHGRKILFNGTKKFKKCSMCKTEWNTRNDFLSDPNISVVGYNVNFEELELGCFLFNHTICGTTLAIEARIFTDLYQGKVFTERKTGGKECLGLCFDSTSIEPCPAQCECAYVREVLNQVANWIKHPVKQEN